MTQSARDGEIVDTLGAPGPLRRLGWLPGVVCRRLLGQVRLDPGAVEHIRMLAARGSVVYVMRYRSLVDYLMIAFVLLREGLPLPEFVSDVRSLVAAAAAGDRRDPWRRMRARAHAWGGVATPRRPRSLCQRLVRAGRPVLIFMRTRAPGVRLLDKPPARRSAGAQRYRLPARDRPRRGQRVTHEVFLVPLAVLRGRGYRAARSRASRRLVYSLQEAPGEIEALRLPVWNGRDTSLTVGTHVALREFARELPARGARSASCAAWRAPCRSSSIARSAWSGARRCCRSSRCGSVVLQNDEVADADSSVSPPSSGKPESQLWRHGRALLRRDGRQLSTAFYFAILEFVFNRIWPRVFQGFEYTRAGEASLECVKQHPVVLVPCHRSHFDYLILSYLFHINYLSPPHIAAGINLSFWPLGAAVPRRRRVLHPPHLRGQPALQGGVPQLPRRSSSARATRRSSSSRAGAAAPARS